LHTNYSHFANKNHGAEDVVIAQELRKLGVHPSKSIDELGRERFHPLSMMHHYNGVFPDWMHSYAANPLKNARLI
jgi:hypothetical protein